MHNPTSIRSLALGALLALGLGSCAVLDEELGGERVRPVVGEGNRVAGLSGSYAYREDDVEERELFALRGTLEQHITDEHAIGVYAIGQFSNIERDPDGREQLWLGVHYHYHHHLSERTSIYAGPQIGWTFFDDERSNDDSFTYGLSGGFRHWLTRRLAFTIEPTLLRSDFSQGSGGDSTDLLVLWGLAVSL